MVDYLNSKNLIFDRRAVRQHRDRARRNSDNPLFEEVAHRLADRVLDVQRTFGFALDVGFRGGACANALRATGRIGRVLVCDSSFLSVQHGTERFGGGGAVVADEEFLPIAPETCDLITSSLTLHWTNDLPGALAQIRRALRPDGLFLAAIFAGETLQELRAVMIEAEI
ncbi:MAG: methyltransferase domain-containing protein, partial [Proteobacteria bacterium]|nr:methyltransferase domain-containing protein [Pseudomonadota bacterium]